jgi:hypothetical protein
VRTAIKTKLHGGGKTLMWWYAPALMEYHKPAEDRMREVTGIGLKSQPFASRSGTAITHTTHPLTRRLEESSLCREETYTPSYYAADEEAQQLGEYTHTGLPSFVVREVRAPGSDEVAWRSVFLGEPYVSVALVQGLCELAGVRIWTDAGDTTHIRPPFLTVHGGHGGARDLSLPEGWVARDALKGDALEGGTFTVADGATRVFLVGRPEELDRLSEARMPEAGAVAPAPVEAQRPEAPAEDETALPIFHIDEEEPIAEPIPPEPPARPKRPRRRLRRSKPRGTVAPAAPEPRPPVEEAEVIFRFRKKA